MNKCPTCGQTVAIVTGHFFPAAETMLRNLLATIHRDGGHYTEKHGLEKSALDAELIVSGWIAGDE